MHCKKGFVVFPSPAGDGKIDNLFLQCGIVEWSLSLIKSSAADGLRHVLILDGGWSVVSWRPTIGLFAAAYVAGLETG